MGQAENSTLGGGEMKRKSWKQPLKKLTALVLNQVESMNKEELEELLHACKTVSETNCGWQEYQMAHIVEHYAKHRVDGIGGE